MMVWLQAHFAKTQQVVNTGCGVGCSKASESQHEVFSTRGPNVAACVATSQRHAVTNKQPIVHGWAESPNSTCHIKDNKT